MRNARFAILLGVLVLTLIAECVLAASPPPTSVSPAPTEPAVAPTEKPQAQWKVVIPQTLFADKMRMASFIDEKSGFMGGAGDPGKAHYTTDGGKNWAVADSSGG
jgi:hypothetical protein